MRICFVAALAALTVSASQGASVAQEITLKGITSFAEKTFYSRGFEKFVDKVNADGKGVIQINYIGGPKAMPPFEVGNAFKNGGFAYMMNLYDQKMNALMLARHIDNNPFHLYLNKPITSADLTGLKLRITPVYRDFFQAQGATVVQTAPGEDYTALERGVVDGYGWPITGIFDLGWHEKTKYRVDPGFYSAEVSVLVNKSIWDKLTDAQRNVLRKAGERAEADAVAIFAEENAKETKRQADAGIATITLAGADGKAYRDKAY